MIPHIINYLQTQSAVTAIVGTRPFKVFPGDVPKKSNNASGLPRNVTVPYATVEDRGGEPVKYMGGRTGTRELSYAVQAVSTSIKEAKALYDAMGDALDSAAHELWDGIEVHWSEMDEGADASIAPTDGAQDSLKVYAGSLFIRVNI